jgi:hypothetical protein
MADGAHRVLGFRVEKSGVVAVHYYAGCLDGQSRKNVLAVGGVRSDSSSEYKLTTTP